MMAPMIHKSAIRGLAVLLVASALSACSLFQRTEDPVARRADAVELTREGLYALQSKGDLDTAESRFQAAIEADPQYADAYINLSFVLQQRGKPRDALQALKSAVRLAPRSAAAFNNLGVLYDRAGQPGLAVNAFKKALELNPALPDLRLNLAVAYGNLQRYDLSATTFLQLVREQPQNVEAYAGLGAVYTRSGQFDSAAAVYEDGLQIAPQSPELLGGLAVVRDMAGDPTSAVDAYDRALALAPEASDLLAARGALALRLGEYRDAAALFGRVSAVEWGRRRRSETFDRKGLAEAMFNLGDIRSNFGLYNQAARDYAYAVTLDPALRDRERITDPDAHFALGVVYQEAGYLTQAAAEYERVLARDAEYWAAWRNLGEVRYEQGNLAPTARRAAWYEKAAEAYGKALQLRRNDARTHYDMGLLYYRQANLEEEYRKKGKYRLAALGFQNALPEMERVPELHLNLGIVFDRLEQYPEAASSYARAATLAPDHPVAWFLGGLAERKAQRYGRAVPLLEKAAALDPGNQDPLYALAILYEEMKEAERAREYYARAAAAGGRGFATPVTSLIR